MSDRREKGMSRCETCGHPRHWHSDGLKVCGGAPEGKAACKCKEYVGHKHWYECVHCGRGVKE